MNKKKAVKKADVERSLMIDVCLDEINASINAIESGKLSSNSQHMSWIRKQKKRLSELGYKGKIRRIRKARGSVR